MYTKIYIFNLFKDIGLKEGSKILVKAQGQDIQEKVRLRSKIKIYRSHIGFKPNHVKKKMFRKKTEINVNFNITSDTHELLVCIEKRMTSKNV